MTVNGGTLDVEVDDGSGYAWITTGQTWVQGSTVLDASYHTLSGVRVRNPTSNAWVGAIEYSSDGGVSYAPFVCMDCTTGSSTARIAVDGDSNAGKYAPTTCFGGATCALSPPATFTTFASLKTAVQAFNADPTAATATYGPIANWDVSAVTDMSGLFKDLKNFNADISNWGTSGVTRMYQMFYVRSSLCPALSLRSDPLPSARSPRIACPPSDSRQYASAFNQPLSFDTTKVTDMNRMFSVRSSPCPAPNLQSSPPPARCVRRGRPPPPASRAAPRPAP